MPRTEADMAPEVRERTLYAKRAQIKSLLDWSDYKMLPDSDIDAATMTAYRATLRALWNDPDLPDMAIPPKPEPNL